MSIFEPRPSVWTASDGALKILVWLVGSQAQYVIAVSKIAKKANTSNLHSST